MHSKFEHLEQKLVFALEEVVEAPWIDVRLSDDCGDTSGVKALLVEKLEGRAENTVLRCRL